MIHRIGNTTTPDQLEEIADDYFVTVLTRITRALLMIVNPVHRSMRFLVEDIDDELQTTVLVDTTDIYEALAYYNGQNTDYYSEAA